MWGIARDRVIVAMHSITTSAVDRSAFFTSDRTAIRATMRLDFGFVQAADVVKIAA